MDFFRFFYTFYRPVLYPMRKKKKNYKTILQITIYEKSTNFTVIVSQMRVLGQKKLQGGRQTPTPPAFIGLKKEPSLQLKIIMNIRKQIV